MKFSVLIHILVKENMIADPVVRDDCDIFDLNLMDRDYRDFNDTTVYFMEGAQASFGTFIPPCLLYTGSLPAQREKDIVNAARITSDGLATVFRFVKTQLDTSPQAQEQYMDAVSKLMAGNNLNGVLSELFTRTGILYAIIDMSGKVLANSSPFYVSYPVWMKGVQQGYCDELLMDYIESRRNSSKKPKTETPFVLYCKKIGMYILVARIIHEHDLLGYFFAINKSPTFDNQTRRLVPLIVQKVKNTMLRLKSANTYHSIMENKVLLDSIAGATPTETRQRAKIARLQFPDNMRVFVLRSNYYKDKNFFERVLQPAVSEIAPYQPCFPWKNTLVLLAEVDVNGNLLKEREDALEELSNHYHLIIGISNRFADIARFAEYYNQALNALSFSSRVSSDSPFLYFLDYVLFMMLDKVEDDDLLDQYCHPALHRLAEYDSRKNTELFETLRVFTQTGFSISRTAQLLFNHRNTISYRIQQIEQLCGIDLGDEQLMLNLHISFNINAYRKNRYIQAV